MPLAITKSTQAISKWQTNAHMSNFKFFLKYLWTIKRRPIPAFSHTRHIRAQPEQSTQAQMTLRLIWTYHLYINFCIHFQVGLNMGLRLKLKESAAKMSPNKV